MSKFKKISKEGFTYQYAKDFLEDKNPYSDTFSGEIYEGIKLPKRATKGSAGYDFYSPFDFILKAGKTIKIPTGIKWETSDNENNLVLKIYPRSGHGFKYRVQLDNTVGVIDSDYCNSDNEGHIWIKLTNDGNEDKILIVKQGEGIAQGIIQEFFITEDDMSEGIRNGGFGSTSK